jgi:PAS domain S-box-containing protein
MKTANQNPAAASRESRRYWVGRLSIIAVVAVALGSMFAIAILREQVGEYNRVQTLLLSLDRTAHEMNSLEWQAIAKKKLDAELSENLEKTRAELATVIGNLALHGLDPQSLKKVTTCYSGYQQAVDAEFELIAAGRFDEAETLDEKRVDPAFNALRESVSAADAVYGGAARRNVQAANVGSTLIALIATGVIGLLFWRFTRARLASQLAKAEQGLLRDANEALQAEVAERMRMGEAMARLSRQNEMILNTAGEGIFGLDLEGRHTFVNPMAARLLGYEAEELVGQDSHSLWHHTRKDGTPYPPKECPIYRTLQEGKPQTGEERFWRKNGSFFLVEFSSLPIREEGKTVGAVVTFRDITERKQAEEALRDSEAIYQSLVTHLTQCISRRDLEGRFTFVNEHFCRLLGKTPAEILGRTGFDLFLPAQAEKHRRDDLRVLQERLVLDQVEEHSLPDGRRIVIQVVKSPLTNAACDVVGVQGNFWDITERKQVETERERLIGELQDALAKVKTLSGLIPICASCKKIRDDKGYWSQVETYVAKHSAAKFSHGICPDCAKELYPDVVG